MSCISSLYILDIKPLLDILFASIFSPSVGSLFLLLIVFFVVHKLFSLMWPQSVSFCFYFSCLRRHIQKKLLRPISRCILPMFSFRIFMFLSLTLKSLIHFEFTFVYGVRKCSNLILLHVLNSCPVFPRPFIEEVIFSPLYILASFVKD